MAFKSCSLCDWEWSSLAEFASDPDAQPLGLVIHFRDPYASLLLFNHRCGTTLAVRADEFRDRLPALGGELRAGQAGCERRCLRFEDLADCDQPCRNAPLRHLMVELIAAKAAGAATGGR
jgi:hypothetical protein